MNFLGRLVWVALFPIMLVIVNPLQELLTTLREWWENY